MHKYCKTNKEGLHVVDLTKFLQFFSGLGLAPFSPWHNSTSVLVQEDLYAGTVADFTGVDPIIFRKPLRTQQYDSTQLNSPDFVASFSFEDFVYFFFREEAVEHTNW